MLQETLEDFGHLHRLPVHKDWQHIHIMLVHVLDNA